MFPEINMGVPKPEKAEHTLTLDEMRAEICKAQYDSAIIRNALRTADYRGLGGEDRYTLLAYSALRALQDIYRQHLRLVSLTPMPLVFAVDSDSAEGIHNG